MTNKIKISGREIILSDNRRVFVGSDGKTDIAYILFRNKEGLESRFKLSRDAADALCILLSPEIMKFELKIETTEDDTIEHFVWKEVK